MIGPKVEHSLISESQNHTPKTQYNLHLHIVTKNRKQIHIAHPELIEGSHISTLTLTHSEVTPVPTVGAVGLMSGLCCLWFVR